MGKDLGSNKERGLMNILTKQKRASHICQYKLKRGN
jgi:hypothetical protein